jgi:uncharacterized protein YhfF
MNPLPCVETVLAKLEKLGLSVPDGALRVDSFGDSPESSAALLALIRSGRKRAGTSLLWSIEAEGEAVPAPGQIALVVDHRHEPALVCRLTDVRVLPFDEVDAGYAAIEGEGDGSLEFWRAGHWAFFTRECRRLGREPQPGMPVVCVVFEVLSVVPERVPD